MLLCCAAQHGTTGKEEPRAHEGEGARRGTRGKEGHARDLAVGWPSPPPLRQCVQTAPPRNPLAPFPLPRDASAYTTLSNNHKRQPTKNETAFINAPLGRDKQREEARRAHLKTKANGSHRFCCTYAGTGGVGAIASIGVVKGSVLNMSSILHHKAPSHNKTTRRRLHNKASASQQHKRQATTAGHAQSSAQPFDNCTAHRVVARKHGRHRGQTNGKAERTQTQDLRISGPGRDGLGVGSKRQLSRRPGGPTRPRPSGRVRRSACGELGGLACPGFAGSTGAGTRGGASSFMCGQVREVGSHSGQLKGTVCTQTRGTEVGFST